jgi:hypothetical protein
MFKNLFHTKRNETSKPRRRVLPTLEGLEFRLAPSSLMPTSTSYPTTTVTVVSSPTGSGSTATSPTPTSPTMTA